MLHPLLESVFHAFDQANVRWCLLRVPANPAAPTGDVDLLIDPAAADAVRGILTALEFAPLPIVASEADAFYLRYHGPTAHWIWLHVVTELSFGARRPLHTRAEAGCLARRQRDGANSALVVLAPDDAFWALLLHCLLDKGHITPRHQARLQELAPQACTDGPLAKLVEQVCPAAWSPGRMVEHIQQGDWGAVEGIAPSLTAGWMRQQRLSAPQLLRHLPERLKQRSRAVLQRRGLTVALLGPDGAGKSTVTAALQDDFFFPARPIYMGLAYDRLPPPARTRVPGLRLLSLLCTVWARYLTALYQRALGRLVVFDRYNYDYRLPPPQPLNWFKRGARWMFAHACPAPDLVLVLDAPGTIMYERKGEFSVAHLEAQRQHFLHMQQSVPQLQIVDASRPLHEVLADVIDRIWRCYATRWSRH